MEPPTIDEWIEIGYEIYVMEVISFSLKVEKEKERKKKTWTWMYVIEMCTTKQLVTLQNNTMSLFNNYIYTNCKYTQI